MSKNKKETKIAGRHFFLIRDAQNCNPNGDPLSDNLPRIDARKDGEYNMISDVSIKRLIRDFMDRNGVPVFFVNRIDSFLKKKTDDAKSKKSDEKGMSGMAGRLATVEKEGIISNTTSGEMLKNLIDLRWFGITRTDGNVDSSGSSSVTGAIQFKVMNYSLNRVEVMTSQHSSVLPSTIDKGQGSLGIMKTIKYGVSVIKATLNPNIWAQNYSHLSDIADSLEDINRFKFALFFSTMEVNTRARNNMNSIVLLEVIYNNRTNSDGTLCAPAWGGIDLGNTFSIEPKPGILEQDIRNSDDYILNLDGFIEAVKKNKARIKQVNFYTENDEIRTKLTNAGFELDQAFSEVMEKEVELC